MLSRSQHLTHPPMKYKHLSQKEREQIYDLNQEGRNKTEIARLLGRNPSSIGREIKRNSTSLERRFNNSPKKKKHYLPDRAHEKYRERRRKAKSPYPLKNPFIRQYTLEHLKKGWNPEQIAGTLNRNHQQNISHECIYQYIYSKHARDKGDRLWEYLPRSHKKRRKRTGRKTRRVLIPNRRDIALRPTLVEKRTRYGDFEGDTIFGKGTGSALATINERKSRYVFIRKLEKKTAEKMTKAMKEIFENLPKKLRKTLTLDNGSENVKHQEVEKETGIHIYFARPYHSWERGTNEWLNGLIRRYYPKRTNFDEVSEEELRKVEEAINNRPMKCLNWKTPKEVFTQQLNILSPLSQKIALEI